VPARGGGSRQGLAGAAGDLTGSMLTIDLRDRSARVHRLIRNPHCPACERPPTGEAVPLSLRTHQSAVFDADGGYRTVPPEETVKKYSHMVSPIVGIVSSLDDSSVGNDDSSVGNDVGHVFTADVVIGVSMHPDGNLSLDRYCAGGKGMTAIQARRARSARRSNATRARGRKRT